MEKPGMKPDVVQVNDLPRLSKGLEAHAEQLAGIRNWGMVARQNRQVRSMPCEDCNGQGEVGEEIYQGEFQPPERDRCSSCGGSGRWSLPEPHPEDVEGNLEAARRSEVILIVERVIELHGQSLDTGEGDVIDLADVLDRWSSK